MLLRINPQRKNAAAQGERNKRVMSLRGGRSSRRSNPRLSGNVSSMRFACLAGDCFAKTARNDIFYSLNILEYASDVFMSSSCVPMAAIRPLRNTMIRSAQRICDRRCVMMKVVRPRAAFEMARWILSSVAESIAEVESSKTKTRGSVRKARASAMRWRCPPESVTPRSPTRWMMQRSLL
jgi:hypothetical protein